MLSLSLLELPDLGLGQIAELGDQFLVLLVSHPVLELLLAVLTLLLRELSPLLTELLGVFFVAHLCLQLVESVSLVETLIPGLLSFQNGGISGGNGGLISLLTLQNDSMSSVGSQLLVIENLELLPPLVARAPNGLARRFLVLAIDRLGVSWVSGDRH